jgi:hypothetical protein
VAAIEVVDLQSAGLPLFNGSDDLAEAMKEPSEQELKCVIGGSKSKKKKGITIIIVNNIYYGIDPNGSLFAPVTNIVIV